MKFTIVYCIMFSVMASLLFYTFDNVQVILMHIVPIAGMFVFFAYGREVVNKSKPMFTRILACYLSLWGYYITFRNGMSLDLWYKTGEVPLNEWESYGQFLKYMLGILIASVVLGTLLFKLHEYLDNKKERKRREKEKLLERLQYEQYYLERARAFKATYGSDSYS